MILSTILWAGLSVALVGLVCLIRPIRFLGIRTRRAAAALVAAGLAAALAVALWPARTHRSEGNLAIDRFMPVYDFHEFHETRVHASPEAVYRSFQEVRADEIRYAKTLMGIRSPPRSSRAGAGNSPTPARSWRSRPGLPFSTSRRSRRARSSSARSAASGESPAAPLRGSRHPKPSAPSTAPASRAQR